VKKRVNACRYFQLSQLSEIHRLKDAMRAREFEQIRIATETGITIHKMEEHCILLNHENTTLKEEIQKLGDPAMYFRKLT
jgi:hypothetical protein